MVAILIGIGSGLVIITIYGYILTKVREEYDVQIVELTKRVTELRNELDHVHCELQNIENEFRNEFMQIKHSIETSKIH